MTSKNGARGTVLDVEVNSESIRTVARIGRWMAHGARGWLNEEVGSNKIRHTSAVIFTNCNAFVHSSPFADRLQKLHYLINDTHFRKVYAYVLICLFLAG